MTVPQQLLTLGEVTVTAEHLQCVEGITDKTHTPTVSQLYEPKKKGSLKA